MVVLFYSQAIYYTTISNCSVLMLLTIYVAGYFVPTTPHFCSGLTQKLKFRSFFASSSAKTQPILLALNTWGWVDLKNNKSQEGSKNTLIRKHWKSLSVRELSAKYVVVESSQPNMGRTCWWQAEMGARAKTHLRRLHFVSSYPIKKSIIWLAARPSLWIVFDMVSWMCHLQTTLCRGHGQTRCIHT